MNLRGALLAAPLALLAGAAEAQRAGDNAVTAAQDAFGTTVGNESVGLYSTGSARGFSPVQAGNVRLEGLYLYQASSQASQNGLDSHLSKGSTVRVGLTAQSYAFPAPTGIADFQLRLPGEMPVVSVVTTYGPYELYQVDVDTQTPLVPGKLGLVIGAGGAHQTWSFATDSRNWSAGALLHWRPSDAVEIIPFYSRSERYDWETPARVSPGGSYLPPQVKRRTRYHQDWAYWDTFDTNYGVLGRFDLGSDWTLRTGLFRSANGRPKVALLLYLNTQPDGVSDVTVVRDPPQSNAAYSGEARLSGRYAEGPRRHTIYVMARGHSARRSYGGGIPVSLGEAVVGVYEPLPEPPLVFGEQGRDKTRQGNVGVSYVGLWNGVGEMSLGVQKAFYRRTFNQPGTPLATRSDQFWLYNGAVAVFATDDLTFYSSYSRGLEESAVAPDSAANRGEALPANITEQVDAGLRYALTPRVRLIAGVFEVKKPYLDRNAINTYTDVGAIKHRGIELSLSGQPLEGLSVVAGAVLLRARITGFTVDQGIIGEIPPSTTPRQFRLNVQYGPPSWGGLAVDVQAVHNAAHQADRLNTYVNPAKTIIDLGGRYQFKAFDSPASLRVQVLNVTNVYSWSNVGASGLYLPGDNARRYMARLSVDF